MNHPNSIYHLFEKVARSNPAASCLIFNNTQLTYKQVEEKVSVLTDTIAQHAHKENIIGVSTTRGLDQIIAVLAILKSGKAYLPLDFKYPTSRLISIIESASLNFCIVDHTAELEIAAQLGLHSIPTTKHSDAHDLRPKKDMADNSAYVLYTSGSTGEPKGVCMGNEAALNLIHWQNKASQVTLGSKTLQFAPLSFDVSFQEITTTLSSGGTLVLIDETLRLDMAALIRHIEKHNINRLFLPFVALQAIAEAAISLDIFPQSLQEIMTAGEQLKITPQLKVLFQSLNNCKLFNQYGPTECHVVTQLKLEDDPEKWPELPTIGAPIDNTNIYILDKKQQVLPHGEIGELCITGKCLAQGYLGKPELTAERFASLKLADGQELRMYRTGDIARFLHDGNIEFLGREDEQVKISGHRIELGEVEIALGKMEDVLQAVVIASDHLPGQTQLIAYIQSTAQNPDETIFRERASEVLPQYMLPSYYVWVNDFPKTTSGKVNKKALPLPKYKRPDNAPLFKKPSTVLQKNIAKNWSELLNIPKIGVHDNFFEFGGTSLLAQKTVSSLRQHFDYEIPIIKLYQHPTIAALSAYLEPEDKSKEASKTTKSKKKTNTDVAIIGMAGRFPGANSVDELWKILKNGDESITFFTQEELDKSIPEALKNDPLYVKARGIISTIKEFDASFFGLNPKIAEAMDPQQRLFLEIAYEVLEQSGYLPSHFKGSVGVYAGTGMNTYFVNNVLPNKTVLNRIGNFVADTINQKDYVASRTSYHLNLKGPAVSVHSACSTSLLAIAEAVDAIRNGRCDVAIAGGSSITTPVKSGHLYQEGSMLSPDGRCRAFDENAQGTIFSDGAGVLLLKSLEEAKKDGDIIHGIIKGIGVNNDGGNKGSFTAPSTEGQADAISRALDDANIKPSEISYVEAHGTATPVGDPIEIEGLKMAFGKQEQQGYCAIGSIKSNIGHLTAAAGVAGVIKTVLALKNKVIPPSVGFVKPNPAIDFEHSPFYVNNTLNDWTSDGPRKAGISSFGVGGTNVHIIVEEFESAAVSVKNNKQDRPVEVFTWSAKSDHSLNQYKTALGHFLQSHPEMPVTDVAYNLNALRDAYGRRSFTLADIHKNTSDKLLAEEPIAEIKSNTLETVPDALAFLFPGQGSQYLHMGRSLYDLEIVFKNAVDICADLLIPILHEDIRAVIYPETNTPEAEAKLKDTKYTQPALFVIEYALAKLWMSWGIHPTLFCGHSIGEFVAAHFAGIFSLEDAIQLVAIRGQLVSDLPGGSMLSVRTNIADIQNIIPEKLSIAAINSDQLVVISGPDEVIENFATLLDAKNIANKLLKTSHAFHSSMMDPVVAIFEEKIKHVELNIPRAPIVSTVTGNWMTDAEATDASYWANHLREAVNFSGAMETILNLDDCVILEVGPGRALTTLSRQKKGLKPLAAISSLTFPKEYETAHHKVMTALGELWINGITPNWKAIYQHHSTSKQILPAYVFDRKPCWLDPPISDETNNDNTAIIEHKISTTIAPKSKPPQEFMRKSIILEKISEIVEDNSGIEIENNEYDHSFLELGLDSLVLTQMAINLKNEFNTPITFRQLNGEFGSPNLLATHLDKVLPEDVMAPPAMTQSPEAPIQNQPMATMPTTTASNFDAAGGQTTALQLIAQQLQLLGKQIELLQGNAGASTALPTQSAPVKAPVSKPVVKPTDVLTAEEKKEHQKPFGASPKIEKQATELSTQQYDFLKELIIRYNNKTAGSKKYTQEHRHHMSDPRVVSGFKPLTKELVYPIVVQKSSGNRLWDIDGNEYIDVLNSFGACLFGHQPEFIKEAIHKQVEEGFEVGPQHPLAGEVCELLCEFTDQDRAALCNTGSEAVLGAMRIARTVTGRSLIVAFSKSYHGINDEVIVRGSKKLKSFPAASGILPEAVKNMLILDYGSDESLRIIKERAHEIAAVLVEPVQSRRPELRPIEFLKEVRKITEASETVLIFDEIITGFRMHPGGAQALFGVKADLATYGKVIGGGISIGAIIGSKKCMDALDGGYWQYGDDSIPEAGVTYFAGTFVRHPLALATTKASLLYMKEKGVALQDELARKTAFFATELNTYFKNKNLPIEIAYYRSLWRLKMLEDVPYAELFFVLMRDKGFHIWDGFPCYMTDAYTEVDLHKLIDTAKDCMEELIAVGFFESALKDASDDTSNKQLTKNLNKPPVKGARLGMDKEGNPAWFIADKDNVGEYIRIDLNN